MKNGLANVTLDQVADAMRELRGNMAAVGRKFGVTRQAIQYHVNQNKVLQDISVECRESMKDNAESSLYKAVIDGEAWAVCFFLKCQARDRGYVENGALDDIKKELESIREQVTSYAAKPDHVAPGD